MRNSSRRIMTGLNGAAALFSAIWLGGHTIHHGGGWELWFAAGYLALTSINAVFFVLQAPAQAAEAG